jgi:hypothetical protein
MAKRTGAAHVVTIKKTVKGKEYRTDLLRRSFRDGKHVRNETLGFCRVKDFSPKNALIREAETLIKQGSHRSSKTRFLVKSP